MIRELKIITILLTFLFLLSFANNATALDIDPFEYFNVYSLGDMGTSDDYYSTDVFGTTGVAGNAYLNMAIGTKQINEYALHTGGDTYIQGGSDHGNFDIGGNADIRNFQISVDIHAKGDVTLVDGSGTGTITTEGSITKEGFGMSDSNLYAGVPYTPMFDYGTLNQYFLDVSSAIGDMTPTGTKRTGQYSSSVVYLDVNPGINVFNINATDFYNTHRRVEIDGPSDAIVYINALDTIANLSWSLSWTSDADNNSDVTPDNVILNFPYATEINFGPAASAYINILAPLADTTRDMGLTTGNLIVGNLYGNGQVNDGHFNYEPEPVPEPATIILLGGGIAGLLGLRKKLR